MIKYSLSYTIICAKYKTLQICIFYAGTEYSSSKISACGVSLNIFCVSIYVQRGGFFGV